jgi:DNA-binding transcriptional regulator YdaS (Cro superfamily)
MIKYDTKPVLEAVQIVGSQKALADLLGVMRQAVWQWCNGKPVTASLCKQIEWITDGAVTAERLRPDIFTYSPQAGDTD